LDQLRSIYEIYGIAFPSVILTDRCLACIAAITRCFPSAISLLCLWHANKAVVAYCKQAFITKDSEDFEGDTRKWKDFYDSWHSIIKSKDEDTFNQRIERLERRYASAYPREVRYLRNTWLDPYKEKLVKAWVNQHAHFGNVVTSRVEGIHAVLKSHLGKSTLDLFDVWRKIKSAVINQIAELA
jgi:hypothetical protein